MSQKARKYKHLREKEILSCLGYESGGPAGVDWF